MPSPKLEVATRATQFTTFKPFLNHFATVFGNRPMMSHGDDIALNAKADKHGGRADHSIVMRGEPFRGLPESPDPAQCRDWGAAMPGLHR